MQFSKQFTDYSQKKKYILSVNQLFPLEGIGGTDKSLKPFPLQ